MKKQLVIDGKEVCDMRIVVIPTAMGDFGLGSISNFNDDMVGLKKRCEQIIEQIMRHVDYVDNAYIEYEFEEESEEK